MHYIIWRPPLIVSVSLLYSTSYHNKVQSLNQNYSYKTFSFLQHIWKAFNALHHVSSKFQGWWTLHSWHSPSLMMFCHSVHNLLIESIGGFCFKAFSFKVVIHSDANFPYQNILKYRYFQCLNWKVLPYTLVSERTSDCSGFISYSYFFPQIGLVFS